MSGLLLTVLLSAAVPAQVERGDSVQLLRPAPEPHTNGASSRKDLVLRWNDLVLRAIRIEATPPPLAARNLAIVHLAIYDAVNGIYRTHNPYLTDARPAAGASPEAAVAAAAHCTLVDLYPRQKELFDAALTESLAELPEGVSLDDGVSLGRVVAKRLLAWRRDDGSANAGRHSPRPGVGLWEPTPPDLRAALLPEWGLVAPFAIRKGVLVRLPGPPPLSGPAYAAAFQEVKALGAKDSRARTAEQTEIALFWADDAGTATPPGHWNQIAQTAALARGTTLAENARLFALLNISLADAGVLCWVFKFTYEFWRPVTAIRRAAEDQNPDTDPDPNWTPLLTTPPFPSYTSGHSTFSGAGAAVLANFFGSDDVRFTATSEGLPGVRRSFPSFSEAAREAGRSRIYGGIHYEFDNVDGLATGRSIGAYVGRHFLQPRR